MKIEQIIQDYYSTEFNQDSIDYYRFITHVKLFAHRLVEGMNTMMKMMWIF